MKSTDKFEFIINKLIVLAVPSNIYEKKILENFIRSIQGGLVIDILLYRIKFDG